MLTITAALVAEHDTFRALFDEIERTLPRTGSLEETQRLARRLEGLLRLHAAAEEDLALLLLDHLPEQKRRCDRFYTEHQEIDAQLTQVLEVRELDLAQELLLGAIAVSRRHFKHEERVVFPLMEQVTEEEQLTKLGLIWARRRESMVLA
jgi:hemerythrin-like domain-containing protein